MRQRFAIRSLLIGTLGLWLATASCQQGEIDLEVPTPEPAAITLENKILTKSDAAKVAGIFSADRYGMASLPSRSSQSIETISNAVGEPLAYVVNNPGSGWVIVSATTDYYPILAYSNNAASTFTLDAAEEIGGLRSWISDISGAIESSGSLDSVSAAQVAAEWLAYTAEPQSTIAPPGGTDFSTPQGIACRNRMKSLNETHYKDGWSFRTLTSLSSSDLPSYITSAIGNNADGYGSPRQYTIVGIKDNSRRTEVGPLLTTEWKQDGGFNALCPEGTIAGCVAIAMAQIMYYHKYPSYFNWSEMKTHEATAASASLVYEAGKAAKTVYGSQASSSDIGKAKDGFEKFIYSATQKDHNENDVYNEVVNMKRPVFMSGTGSDGHAWVCDGVIDPYIGKLYYVEYINSMNEYTTNGERSLEDPAGYSSRAPMRFSMNWGWGSNPPGWTTNPNGWYGDPKPGQYKKKKKRKNLYVHPK